MYQAAAILVEGIALFKKHMNPHAERIPFFFQSGRAHLYQLDLYTAGDIPAASGTAPDGADI